MDLLFCAYATTNTVHQLQRKIGVHNVAISIPAFMACMQFRGGQTVNRGGWGGG